MHMVNLESNPFQFSLYNPTLSLSVHPPHYVSNSTLLLNIHSPVHLSVDHSHYKVYIDMQPKRQ